MADRAGVPSGAVVPYLRGVRSRHGDTSMASEPPLLVALVLLVDRIPLPAPPPARRGRPRVYPDRLFLKALVIMLVKRLPTVHLLLAVLEEPTPEMRRLRA